ncbi:MAG: hypothetical protein KF893_17775 [Caldilineaceae bacterium]|nr:hypothetical protein [Caldilineaceae bacterium]
MATIQIEKDIMVPTCDGVRLAADLYRLANAADQYRPAINRIFHDAAHPSRLILPVIER